MFSLREYLSLERDGNIRHEWIGGELVAMAGGTGRHNRVALRLASALDRAADGCRVYVADMKVVTANAAYYPDVMVVCAAQADDYYETEPCLIVEVFSPTTAERDRREKRMAYQAMASMQHYVMVDPVDLRVTHYRREPNGEWATQIVGQDGHLRLSRPDVTLDLATVFDGL
jgi:Uma2 family endonuclease